MQRFACSALPFASASISHLFLISTHCTRVFKSHFTCNGQATLPTNALQRHQCYQIQSQLNCNKAYNCARHEISYAYLPPLGLISGLCIYLQSPLLTSYKSPLQSRTLLCLQLLLFFVVDPIRHKDSSIESYSLDYKESIFIVLSNGQVQLFGMKFHSVLLG